MSSQRKTPNCSEFPYSGPVLNSRFKYTFFNVPDDLLSRKLTKKNLRLTNLSADIQFWIMLLNFGEAL